MSNKSGYELSYQATQSKGRRQAPQTRTKSEDLVLKSGARRKLLATARDQQRNFAVLGWMLRKHLDYVSKFNPLVKTGSDELDMWLDRALKRHAKKRNFDVAGRHSRNSMMRIFEGLKTLDGDCALLKAKGLKFQGIESDRIAKAHDTPKDVDDAYEISDLGLVIDPMTGGTTHYSVCKRDDVGGTSLEFAAIIPARDIIFDGYFGRFDQTRGISPLSSIINPSADLYEAMEFTQLKIKLESLMGIQINRQLSSEDADGFATTESLAYDTDANGTQTADNSFEFSPQGVSIFDMDPGESISTIESNNPSEAFQAWTDRTIRQILLALDIPYSAYAGDQSNFSARIADREEYEKSCQDKRQRNCEVLEDMYEWVINGWYRSSPELRRLTLAAGKTREDLIDCIQWVSTGTPWLDKLKEVNGDAMAVYNGFESRQDICKRRGTDFYEVVDKLAAEQEYAEEKGVQLAMGSPGQQTIMQVEEEATPEQGGDNE